MRAAAYARSKAAALGCAALAVAATLSLPNVNVAEEAVALMRAAKATGLEPGIGDADKQYWANSLEERLHDPAFNEGFTASTDYRIDRLGIQGGDHGANFIEGAVYCPGTPKPLTNASVELHNGTIDSNTYRARIGARKAFELHVKEKPDAKGRTMLRCPAIGPSPTVTCPLRELLKTRKPVADKERPPSIPRTFQISRTRYARSTPPRSTRPNTVDRNKLSTTAPRSGKSSTPTPAIALSPLTRRSKPAAGRTSSLRNDVWSAGSVPHRSLSRCF
jgi:hypothetical protein